MSILLPFLGAGFFPLLVVAIIFIVAANKEQKANPENSSMVLKKVYLYMVSLIALVIGVVGSIMLLNQLFDLVFKTDLGYGYNAATNFSAPLSMIIVSAPVWYYHWRLARKEV